MVTYSNWALSQYRNRHLIVIINKNFKYFNIAYAVSILIIENNVVILYCFVIEVIVDYWHKERSQIDLICYFYQTFETIFR